VADEQVDPGMAREDPPRRRLDRLALGDVAGLVLVGVGGWPPREPDDAVAAPAQLAAELRADPGGGARDDCDAHAPLTVTSAGVRGEAGARSRGGSRADWRPAARGSRSRTRASGSKQPCASWRSRWRVPS